MRRSLLYVAIAAVQAIGSIGAPLLVARFVGPRELGVIAVGLLVSVLARALFSLGLYGPVSLALHDGPAGANRARGLLRISGELCLPLGVVTLAVALLVPSSGAYLAAVACGAAGAVALGHQSLHRSATDHWAYAAAVLGPTAFANIAALIFVAFGPQVSDGAEAYLMTMAAVSLLTSAALHLRYVMHASRPERSVVKAALRVGGPLMLTASATVGLSLGDRPLIQAFLGEGAVGRYHLVYILAAGGLPLLAAINNAWLPSVLNVAPEQRLAALGRSTAGVVLGVAVLAIGASLVAPTLVRFIGGAEFVTDSTPLQAVLIAIAVIPYAVYSGMSIGLLSVEGTRGIAESTTTGVVFNLAANVALIPLWGLVGACVASLIGYGAASMVAWWRLGGQQAVPWLSARVGALLIGASALAFAAAPLPVDGLLAGVVRVTAGGLAGGVGCLMIARATSGSYLSTPMRRNVQHKES